MALFGRSLTYRPATVLSTGPNTLNHLVHDLNATLTNMR